MGYMVTGATVALAALAVAGVANAQEARTAKAKQAAKAWLALVDAGSAAASWDDAAALFRRSVPKEQWESAVSAVRAPLGRLESRKLLSASPKKQLPGAPDGDYLVIQYQSRFQHKADAVETVTPMRESNGTWKVAGYFVK
ncbi:MAG: DUF4019 domain-containing protein [Burkholderiales bacterium]